LRYLSNKKRPYGKKIPKPKHGGGDKSKRGRVFVGHSRGVFLLNDYQKTGDLIGRKKLEAGTERAFNQYPKMGGGGTLFSKKK